MGQNRIPHLVPGLTLWRQVLHFPNAQCQLAPDTLPVGAGTGSLRVNMVSCLFYEPELVGGLQRGILAHITQDGYDPNWTHAEVISLRERAIYIEIQPPMPDYLQWRTAYRQAALMNRGQFFDRATQLRVIKSLPCPTPVAIRLRCGLEDYELLRASDMIT